MFLTAGCIGAASPGEDPPEAAGELARPDAPPTVTSWDGHILAGAAYDLPGHFAETEELVEPVMRSGAALMFDEAPTLLEVELTWTGAPGTQVMLMVGPPTHTEEEGGNMATPFSAEPVHCIRVPSDALAAGHWSAMIHTLAGADVSFTITARSLGGEPMWHDTHGHTVAAFRPAANEARPFDACEGVA